MKKLFLLVLAFAFAYSAQAQSIGVKAGYGMSGYTTNFYVPDGSKMASGLNLGLVAGLDLKVIELRGDVTFLQLGSDYESPDAPMEQNSTVNYLNIGVSAMKGIGPVYVGVGPYFGMALSSTQETIIGEGDDAVTTTIDIFDEPNEEGTGGMGDLYNKSDFGANLLVGAKFTGVFVEGYAGYGFMNFINTDSDNYEEARYVDKDDKVTPVDAKQNNLFFGLSVGYTFGF